MTEIMKTLMPAFVPSCFNFWSSDPIFHLSQSCLSSWTLVQSVGKTNCYRGSHSAFWWDEQNPHHQHSLIGWKYSRPKNNWGGEFESPWWFHFSDLCSFQQDHNEHREQLNGQHNISSCFYRRPLLAGFDWRPNCSWDWLGKLLEESLCLWLWQDSRLHQWSVLARLL